MRVRYEGPSARITIQASGQRVERGETVEVDDKLGKQLCEQEVWVKAPEPKKEKE